MLWNVFSKKSARRREIRRNRPDTFGKLFTEMRETGALKSIWVAVVFAALAFVILLFRQDVVDYRPGQRAMHDIVSRVDFNYQDEKVLQNARREARESQPRIYKASAGDVWDRVEKFLLELPDQVANARLAELTPPLSTVLDAASLASLQEYQPKPQRNSYEQWVKTYVREARGLSLTIIPDVERRADLNRTIIIPGLGTAKPTQTTYSLAMEEELSARLMRFAVENFPGVLQPKVVKLTRALLTETHTVDDAATTDARNRAEERVPESRGNIEYKKKQTLVVEGEIRDEDWKILRAENREFIRQHAGDMWGQRFGLAGVVIVLTMIMAAYVASFQSRIVRNSARATAVAALMLSMLLLTQLAAVGSSPLYTFGLAPTVLVAMILTIAYDQRFAVGMASIHAVFVTLALDQGVEFFLVLEAGVCACCFLLDDLRTRSKLVEVGGMTALALMASTATIGLLNFDPLGYIARNSLYSGAAGLAVGFIVLGILPFIEKAFRITTSLTLLELADASNPLLRRLSVEAPGTYNHSLQVATLSEAAAESINANSLLCRVAAYYHDVGKINKPDYFIENQTDGHNRHMNLTPSVSLLIIVSHVKDGVELAKEYNLPTSIIPFIQQHHGTTLVEYFYYQACHPKGGDGEIAEVSEAQYRYPGPKPKTREIALVMLADAVESACRALPDTTQARIENLIEELTMKRLLDGQFDECDLSLKQLQTVKKSMTKTLMGIYHGRIAYPSTNSPTAIRGNVSVSDSSGGDGPISERGNSDRRAVDRDEPTRNGSDERDGDPPAIRSA